ncbi:MAG TPA: outer membrane beta-barrel protein [Thermoanaerobaculia bacterium]
MRRALLALLFIAVPAAAFAQPGQFEITPTVGYRFAGEIENAGDIGFPDFDQDVEVDESATFGIIFDIPLTPNWRLELMANRQDTGFSVDEGLFSPAEDLGDVSIDFFQAGFLYQWGLGQVNPFIVGTLGLARVTPDFPELDAENYFSGTLGGGVKVFFSENVGLRFEGRGYWTNLDTDFDERYDRYDSEGDLVQGEASAGLIIAF